MSLSVLKKKSNIRNSRISSSKHSKNGFSLNNPRRVDSHSGQSQIQTPMKGNVPRGHGSCCGKYPINIVKSRYNNYDQHIREFNGIKSNPGISVKNTRGSISTRFKWINRPYPYAVSKKMEPLTYEQYMNKKKGEENICNRENNTIINGCNNCSGDRGNCKKQQIINKRVDIKSQSEYIQTNLLTRHCLPPKGDKVENPKPVSGSCNSACNQ